MIDDTLLKTLKSTLINNESSLRNCKEWMGINKKNGLWDYIIRIDNVLKKEAPYSKKSLFTSLIIHSPHNLFLRLYLYELCQIICLDGITFSALLNDGMTTYRSYQACTFLFLLVIR